MGFGRFSCSYRGGLASVRPLLASPPPSAAASSSAAAAPEVAPLVAPLASPLAPVAPTPSQCPPTPRCPSAAAAAAVPASPLGALVALGPPSASFATASFTSAPGATTTSLCPTPFFTAASSTSATVTPTPRCPSASGPAPSVLCEPTIQWRELHDGCPRAVHLLYNIPGGLRFLSHRADPVPGLLRHMPASLARPTEQDGCVHEHVPPPALPTARTTAPARHGPPAIAGHLSVLHCHLRPVYRRSRRHKLHSLAQLSVGLQQQPDMHHHADFARHRKSHDSDLLLNGSML